MNSRKIGSKMFIFLWVIFSASCVMDQVDHEIIGRWETNIIHSTDLGSVRHVMDLKKNQNYTSYTYLDSGEVMIFAGSFFFKDGIFSIQSRIGYGLEDGKKVYEEKIHVVQKFEIIALDFHNLVLRELKDSHEEIISFQRVIEE
jgi:hypothetical protein